MVMVVLDFRGCLGEVSNVCSYEECPDIDDC